MVLDKCWQRHGVLWTVVDTEEALLSPESMGLVIAILELLDTSTYDVERCHSTNLRHKKGQVHTRTKLGSTGRVAPDASRPGLEQEVQKDIEKEGEGRTQGLFGDIGQRTVTVAFHNQEPYPTQKT